MVNESLNRKLSDTLKFAPNRELWDWGVHIGYIREVGHWYGIWGLNDQSQHDIISKKAGRKAPAGNLGGMWNVELMDFWQGIFEFLNF